ADAREIALTQPRESGAVMFVLFSSNRGLCGGLNAQLSRALFRSAQWKDLAPADRLLVTVGRKASEAARQEGVEPTERFEAFADDLTTVKALEIANHLLEYWTNETCREIVLVSPRYVNAFTYEPTKKTYLPLDAKFLQESWKAKEGKDETKEQESWLFYEPSREHVIERLSLQLSWSLLTSAFFEFKASEYSSRMVAMRHATEAAEDIIHSMTREYHKARQAQITQQLAELAGASEAMNAESLELDYV
ncbi:F0F1 ATP synthase subunit gamma, partial [Candidatus Uhrbacteria bacterium]|nr:F0F1 ATP synthase subunit gamma [Candidatus Uhrbacteria bacterium]